MAREGEGGRLEEPIAKARSSEAGRSAFRVRLGNDGPDASAMSSLPAGERSVGVDQADFLRVRFAAAGAGSASTFGFRPSPAALASSERWAE
jgi:hypothetical protein